MNESLAVTKGTVRVGQSSRTAPYHQIRVALLVLVLVEAFYSYSYCAYEHSYSTRTVPPAVQHAPHRVAYMVLILVLVLYGR